MTNASATSLPGGTLVKFMVVRVTIAFKPSCSTLTSRSFHQYIYKLNEIKVKLFPPENDW